MILVTKMNNTQITINEDFIETMEETPDTVLTFTTGKKLIVKEEIKVILQLIKKYKSDLYSK